MRQRSHDDTDLAAEGPATETVVETVRRCAHAMLLRADEVSAVISSEVLANVAGLTPNGSAQAVQALRDSTDQNIGAIFATLAFGVSADAAGPPIGTQDLLRHTVAGDGDITTLLRAYRYGHGVLWQIWSDHVAENVGEATRLHDVLSMSAKHIFLFIDRSCERLVDDYHTYSGERSRTYRRSEGEVIRDLLCDDTPVDEGLASSVLRCDVGGYHLALVLSVLAADADVHAAADTLAAGIGATSGARLVVGDGALWLWLTWPDPPSEEQLESLRQCPLKEIVVGMGEVSRGRAGFAQSQRQARDAARVARLGRTTRGGVIRFRDVELAGILCNDTARARRFAEERLSVLLGSDPSAERLRETLLVYLDNGCGQSRTADILHVHPKTVSYRLAQAEQLLGHPLTRHVLEVGAALTVAQTLTGGPANRRKS